MRHAMRRGGLAIVLMITAVGCAAYSGTGGLSSEGLYNPVTGNYTQEFSASVDQTYEATREVMKILDLTPVRHTKDRLGAHIAAKRANGAEVEVTIRPKGLAWTEVTIEVGRGNETASVRFAQEMERRLKLMRR